MAKSSGPRAFSFQPLFSSVGNMCSVPFTFTIAPSSTPMPMPSSWNHAGGVTVEDGVDATADVAQGGVNRGIRKKREEEECNANHVANMTGNCCW